MRTGLRKITLAACAAGLLGFGSAQAATIDLTGFGTNFDQSAFGSTGTENYAQTVLAEADTWVNLGFGVTDNEGGTFDLEIDEGRAAGLAGTGFAPDVNSKLFDQTLNHLGGGLENFDLALNLAVDPGTTYVFVLNAVSGALAGASVPATAFRSGDDKYVDGEFIFASRLPFSSSISWNSRFNDQQDLAFKATFENVQAVPLPAALPLTAGVLGLLGFIGF